MGLKISLRFRLAFWYTIIVTVSLSAFGIFTYLSASNELYSNLDASLLRVAISLDDILKQNQNEPIKKEKFQQSHTKDQSDKFAIFRESEKNRFIGPLRPTKNNSNDEESKDIVWGAIYEHILLNPKNYLIQIADSTLQIIWKSGNLQYDSLPILPVYYIKSRNEAAGKNKSTLDSLVNSFLRNPFGRNVDSSFSNVWVNKQSVRLLTRHTRQAFVSVGYTVEDIDGTLKELFGILLIAFPVILFVSTIGGLVLSKLSLRAVEEITRTAEEITASNLSRRIPDPKTNDEIAHLTNTLNQMITRLQDSFSQIRQFTSDASHELRTPLTIMRGELEIALSSDKNLEEYQIIIASALEETERLSNVVETLLDLTRADTGQVRMNFVNANLSKFMLDIAEDAEILAEFKNITVIKRIEDNVVLNFDADRMHQAVLNLIDNAIKYTSENGNVFIDLLRNKNNNNVEIKISDTGMGIPKEHLNNIFDRFYRIDRSRSHDIKGTGLGLSIVNWIVKAHNGHIEVDSEPNKGTCFTVVLSSEMK